MSQNEQYESYLKEHINNVKKGYQYLKTNLPNIFNGINIAILDVQIKKHDKSKYSDDEFIPYRNYFYGTKTKDVKEAFDLAWLHHQKENPHHWQYWVLLKDEDKDKVLDMPKEYIIEMLCDWWAFSWSKGNLYEVFDWYKDQDIRLSTKTRKTLENIMSQLKKYLDNFEYSNKVEIN